jgi:pimeloyl-ACP methyl ester carboxylesterase
MVRTLVIALGLAAAGIATAPLATAQSGAAAVQAPAAKAAVAPKPFTPTRFSVVTSGSGPDVILIPGLTASRDVWKGAVAQVPGYRYHLIQVAGFAGAPARGNARGEVVRPLAAEIARYIQARGLRKPAIVGHSMGGTLAMMVAARNPGLAGKVMVVDMLPQPAGIVGGSASNVRGLADALRGLSGSEGGRQLIASAIRMFGNDAAENSRSDPDVVARATHELALIDLTGELPKISAPMTVVYANLDTARPATADRIYASGYANRKGTRLVRIDNSGHMVMYDQPAKFAGTLKSFLGN